MYLDFRINEALSNKGPVYDLEANGSPCGITSTVHQGRSAAGLRISLAQSATTDIVKSHIIILSQCPTRRVILHLLCVC